MNRMKGSSISRQEETADSLVWKWTITRWTLDLSHQTVKDTEHLGEHWRLRLIFPIFKLLQLFLHCQAKSLPAVPPGKPLLSFSSKENSSVFSHKQELGKHSTHVSLLEKHLKKEDKWWESPGGPVVKDPPPSAWGIGSVPGQGARIPHSPQPEKPKHKKEAMW